jgi:hypothetical protein
MKYVLLFVETEQFAADWTPWAQPSASGPTSG